MASPSVAACSRSRESRARSWTGWAPRRCRGTTASEPSIPSASGCSTPTGWRTATLAPAPPAPGLHQQLDELIAFRDRLVRTTDELVGELSRVLTELGVDAPDPATTPLLGDVVLDAAPFADLTTLASLEQALRTIGGVAYAQVRTLDAGRAQLDVRLTAPIPLGAALRAVWPVPFRVTVAGDGQVQVHELPEVYVASTVHQGKFEDFTNAHAAILKWAEANGYQPLEQYREIYIVGPHSDAANTTTEVQFVVEKKRE